MSAAYASFRRRFFSSPHTQWKSYCAGLMGLLLLFGGGACNKISGEQAAASLNKESPKRKATFRVVPCPVHRWVQGLGKVQAGNTAHEITLIAKIRDWPETHQVGAGQKIEFRADRFPEARFEGTIASIQKDNNSTGMSAHIRVTTGREQLRIGDLVLIDILQEEKSMLGVPKTALLFKEGRFFVLVLAEGQTVKKEVNPLFANSDQPLFAVSDSMILLQGLTEGDEVLVDAIAEESA
jgi:hypothetical protein